MDKRLTAAPPVNDDDFSDEEWQQLEINMGAEIGAVYQMAQKDLGTIGISFNVPDLYAEYYAKNRAADLVTRIRETTRERLNEVISRGISEGLGPQELKDAILEDFDFSVNRAKLIARTEMAFAYNAGQMDALKEAGIAAVKVLDGLSADSDEPCKAVNGKVISLQTAAFNLIQHPNCVRSFSPVPSVPGQNIDLQDDEFLAVVGAGG